MHPALPLLSLRANDHQVVSAAQMLGGVVAAALLNALTPGPLAVGVTLGNGTNRTQGVFIEMFTTAALVLSVLMLAAGESTPCLSPESNDG
jgi:aquaporin related protein